MQKFLALTTLNALDQLPVLGRKVETKPNPAAAVPCPISEFERKPHELHPGRSGQAGRSDAQRVNGATPADYATALSNLARTGSNPSELFRPFIPHGDQRPAGEGQSGHGYEGRHEADHRADPRNTGGCVVDWYLQQIEECLYAYIKIQSVETGRTSSARPSVSQKPKPGWDAEIEELKRRIQAMKHGPERTLLKNQLYFRVYGR